MNRILEILDRLIAFPTVSADTNLPMIDWIEEHLKDSGFTLHRISDETGRKAGLFASLGPAGEGGTLLSAHTDVVPVSGQNWTREPFQLTRDGDLLFGRGTTDMKGYLASILHLAELASGKNLARPLKLALSYDEEIGCVGIGNMIDHLAPTIGLPNNCIVGEPTSMLVAIGHKGKASFKVACHGENGHSAMAPSFVNALHIAAEFVGELRKLQQEYAQGNLQDPSYDIPYTSVHVGTLKGGTALNMVPSQAEMAIEYRHIPQHKPAIIDQDLNRLCDNVADRFTLENGNRAIGLEQVNSYPGLVTAEDHELVTFGKNITNSVKTVTVPFGTEAGYFSQLGIPTIVCGPGSMEEQGHKPDENIHVSELQACHEVNLKVLDSLF